MNKFLREELMEENRLQNLPPSSSPSLPPSSNLSILDPEAAMVEHLQKKPEPALVIPNTFGVGAALNIAHNHNNLDWPVIIVGFCFSWAVAIAFQSFQTCATLPHSVSFHLLCLAMAVAVAVLFVSKYISPKFPNRAKVLEHVGVLFGVTAFFLAITLPFSLCLKLIYWAIYALSLLAIFLSIRR